MKVSKDKYFTVWFSADAIDLIKNFQQIIQENHDKQWIITGNLQNYKGITPSLYS